MSKKNKKNSLELEIAKENKTLKKWIKLLNSARELLDISQGELINYVTKENKVAAVRARKALRLAKLELEKLSKSSRKNIEEIQKEKI